MDAVTVIIATSPIPSNPDTRIIHETIRSIRNQIDSAIVITADGVRPEQVGERGENYEVFLDRLEGEISAWAGVSLLRMPQWGHQANAAREALTLVDTPLILFMEHDTPLMNEHYDWPQLVDAAESENVNVIRFYHESRIHPEHRYLMMDNAHVHTICGVPLVRTVQWSQRPHLAKSDFYRSMLKTYFGLESRTMIEDVMHGVVWTTYNELGSAGWDQFKLWLYHPLSGSIQRSDHVDGREDDPKFEMYYEYEGHETPFAAPARTAGRID